MSEKKFYLIVFFIMFLLVAAINVLYFLSHISYARAHSYILSCMFTTINFIGAVFSIKLGSKKSVNDALNKYLIGMSIRLPLFLGVIILSLIFLDINRNSFIFSILILYVFYLISEIVFLIIQKS